ncbi:unnamed protein product [marine sediment metagenome]|uniref:Methyltransferase type 11 domain-containing protein n=1 Tax=marine sediment metagenome TaxID=412755 RepID=X1FZQ7_9ZZZZ
MDGAKTELGKENFDIIIASDILEHIENDIAALAAWNRTLKQGGRIIIFVPAFRFLWTGHDEANRHFRRYSKLELLALLKKNNFEIERSSYWNFSLFLPIGLTRIFEKAFSKNKKNMRDQLYELKPAINQILTNVLSVENRILKVVDLPVGLSVFAIARKKR